MENSNRRLIIVFLSIAVTMLIAGCFSGYFIVYIWTNTVRLTSANYATDSFVAMTLCAYFVMCGFFGAAAGLFIDSLGFWQHRRRSG